MGLRPDDNVHAGNTYRDYACAMFLLFRPADGDRQGEQREGHPRKHGTRQSGRHAAVETAKADASCYRPKRKAALGYAKPILPTKRLERSACIYMAPSLVLAL